ncbi:S8 family peptidase [Deinococcus yavapaiensis]|uniref:Subtilase family protein n=1 Tax=Deinococcus yavapaiensis KR-236 TaxID=694435 RepID=A0A318SCM5_9DEIO|nr:S8 family peptidase [Deinococcus yavapaiensis]PYE55004.1 subtilase family protein [Deinococcus yavapaiensis KR-236]
MKNARLFGLITLTALLAACGSTSNTPSAPSAQAAEFVPGEVLVQLDSSLRAQSLTALAATLGVQSVEVVAASDGAPLVLAKLSSGQSVESAVASLGARGDVRYAEPNFIYHHDATSTDPYFTNGSLWGMYGPSTTPANQFGSNAAAAWASGSVGSSTVYVGIIDEGIQYNHPDLAGNVGNPNEIEANGKDDDGNGFVDDKYGWDFANNDNTVYDGGNRGSLDAHGTHVSGTIGARSNNVGVVGVNHNVRLISGKFLGRNGGTSANAIKALDYFIGLKNKGLNIVATNNSWGGGSFSQALRDAIERSNTAGILFVAAAGNGGSDGVGDNNDATPHYPSTYDNSNIIAVAAITSSGGRSSFSNYGAKTVDIGAPGSGINSTVPYDKYASYNGTSMATPHVTGAVALYAAAHPGASAAQIKNAILSSAVPTPSLSGITVTGGRLDAFAALSK